jgi:PRTRC genetic system ThiF family protein
MNQLDLSYLNARRLLLPAYDSISLVLVGCGGTGSFMARGIATTARLLIDKFQKDVDIAFIDPDVVEEKNCYRQNFCPAEIGRNKAEALAFRFGLAWGLEIVAVPRPFTDNSANRERMRANMVVVIGCVDNAAGRAAIKSAISGGMSREGRAWWLDCGNHKSSGQVLLGCGSGRPKDPFGLPGACTWLPLPTERHPDLLEALPEENMPDTTNMSCADLAMLDSQGLAINQRVAAEATDYLVRMLLTRDLQKQATYMDLASGSSRSIYIGGENAG